MQVSRAGSGPTRVFFVFLAGRGGKSFHLEQRNVVVHQVRLLVGPPTLWTTRRLTDNNVRGEARTYRWSDGKTSVTDDVAEDAVKAKSGTHCGGTSVPLLAPIVKVVANNSAVELEDVEAVEEKSKPNVEPKTMLIIMLDRGMRLDDRGNSQSIEEVFVETRKAVAYFQKVHFGLTSAQQYWPHGLVPMEGLGALKETAVICFDGGGGHPRSVEPTTEAVEK